MLRRAVYVVGLLLVAWTMGLELAHVLEWAPKAHYPAELYVRLQESLYVWFGNIGSVIYGLAIVATVVLAVLLRQDRTSRWPVLVAAILEVIALVVFLTVVYPANFRFPVGGSGVVPPDWMALRDRWELGHTIGFALFTAAFVLLLAGAVRGTSTAPVPPPPDPGEAASSTPPKPSR